MDGQGTTTQTFAEVCRADLHCHSTASQESKLGVQRAAGLPECATPPEEVYELAKRRGMDFVTITDHDTISGVLQIAERPDVFVSEELTAHLRGWLEGERLARAYACADIFLFPSRTDTFGQVVLEAQASGLPVVAVAEGGPLSLIEQRVSGLLCAADAHALADAVLELAGAPELRARLVRGGLAAVRERTWEQALARLGDGYRLLLGAREPGRLARAA